MVHGRADILPVAIKRLRRLADRSRDADSQKPQATHPVAHQTALLRARRIGSEAALCVKRPGSEAASAQAMHAQHRVTKYLGFFNFALTTTRGRAAAARQVLFAVRDQNG